MKLTNKYNLPQTFVNVLNRNQYTKGKAHASVTELISPPRIVQLRKLNWDFLEEDVADKIWAIFGTAIHSVLELGKAENHIIEQRLPFNQRVIIEAFLLGQSCHELGVTEKYWRYHYQKAVEFIKKELKL